MKTIVVLALAWMSVVLAGGASADIPATIGYQGVLTELSGTPVSDGNYSVTFRLYATDIGGTPVWTETQLLAITGGVFAATLGSVSPMLVDFSDGYWLGVSVDGGAELAPRSKLNAAPYALNAKNVANGVAVRSINGLTDGVSIVGGPNMTVSQSGNAIVLTATGSGGGSEPVTGNTLDGAYDEGGAGAGRVITTDAGAVRLQGTGGLLVDGHIGIGVELAEVPVHVEGNTVYGVYGETTNGSEASAGVFGALNNTAAASGASGVIGVCVDQSAITNGVWGDHATLGIGVFGTAPDGFGVAGFAYGGSGQNVGVYGESASPEGWAGYMYGDLAVLGGIYTGSAAMMIDHPERPAEASLVHPAVHSDEMLNVYSGNAVLDVDGSATVAIPSWIELINQDYRYQLTPIGAPMPNLYVADEIAGGTFAIAGGEPGKKVSWTVTGVRKDPVAAASDRSVVRAKPATWRGRYHQPGVHGASRDSGIVRRPNGNRNTGASHEITE